MSDFCISTVNGFKEGIKIKIKTITRIWFQKLNMALFDYWYHLNPVSYLKPAALPWPEVQTWNILWLDTCKWLTKTLSPCITSLNHCSGFLFRPGPYPCDIQVICRYGYAKGGNYSRISCQGFQAILNSPLDATGRAAWASYNTVPTTAFRVLAFQQSVLSDTL